MRKKKFIPLKEWSKCPSVRGGGKEYFYTIATPKGRRWVIWDRYLETYTVQDEKYWDGKKYVNDIIISVKTVMDGMKFVEKECFTIS